MMHSRAGGTSGLNKLLGVLSDAGQYQVQLDAFRKAIADADAARKKASAEIAKLKCLQARQKQLEDYEAALNETAATLRSRGIELDRLDRQVTAVRADNERAKANIKAVTDEAKKQAQQLLAQAQQTIAKERDEHKARCDNANEAINKASKRLAEHQAKLDKQAADLDNREARLKAAWAEFEAEKAKHNARVEQLRKLLP